MTDWTHDATLTSWVASANDPATDFPIQNLPFGRFRLAGDRSWRIGVAIGAQVLDLASTRLIPDSDIRHILGLDAHGRKALRAALVRGLLAGSAEQSDWSGHLYQAHDVEVGLPCDIRDYTDFYAGIHHAATVGRLFRPEQPLLPNYRHVPIGYHGRASTIRVSGKPFHRPRGQSMVPGQQAPAFGPSRRLDFELELGVVIGLPNEMGVPVPIGKAQEHIAGLTLLNDWSARDIQAWEYQPLGPFLSKNFATTLSPWVVTLEALAPFRGALNRAAEDPAPLPYLSDRIDLTQGAFDIGLEVAISTQGMRDNKLPEEVISRSNFREAAYWTVSQLVAHHTVGGCALSPGDLFGTGTLSGKDPVSAGSLIELTAGGKIPVRLSNGEQRLFLEDGDAITLRAMCERRGFRRIGFGACTATVLPPVDPGAG